jgi:hypothetical protein
MCIYVYINFELNQVYSEKGVTVCAEALNVIAELSSSGVLAGDNVIAQSLADVISRYKNFFDLETQKYNLSPNFKYDLKFFIQLLPYQLLLIVSNICMINVEIISNSSLFLINQCSFTITSSASAERRRLTIHNTTQYPVDTAVNNLVKVSNYATVG